MSSTDYPRSHRVADFIHRELADLIRTEVQDPRLSPMLTISAVEVSRDLAIAKVYFTVIDAQERRDTEAALSSAAGFLRRKLAPRINIRAVPELRFHYDDSTAHGAHMSAVIDQAIASNTTEDDTAADSRDARPE